MARPFSVLLVLLVFDFFRLFFPVSSVSAAGPYYYAACSASTGAYSINLTVSGIEPTFTHGGGNDFVLFYLTFKGLDSELSPATKETIKQMLGTPGYQNPSDAGDFAYRVTNELPVLSVAEGKYFVTTSVTDSTQIGNLTFGKIKERLPNVPLHIAANLNLDGVWISKYVGGKTFYVKSGQCSNAHIPPTIPAGCPYVDCSGNIVCPAGFELDRRSCPTCTCTPINKVTKTWSVRAVIDGCTGGKILNRNIRFFSASWTEGQNHPNAFYWDQQPYTKELTRTVNINNYTPNDTLFFGLESDLIVTKNKWGGSYGGGTAQANQELQPVGTKPHASMEYAQSFNPYTWMVSFPRESVAAGTYEVHFKIPDQYVSTWCIAPTPTPTQVPTPTPYIPPIDCMIWFDGCNRCTRSVPGASGACTRKGCSVFQTPYCIEVFPTATPVPTNTPIPTATPTPDPCRRRSEGDTNCDTLVNQDDYESWKSVINGSVLTCAGCSADFDRNNRVDLVDFEIWRNTVYR